MAVSKNIGIVHYRVGRTDGVSLEIEKRKRILEDLGHTVKLISGPVQNGADFIIDALEFDRDDIKEIKENCFAFFKRQTLNPRTLLTKIQSVASEIEKEFLEIHQVEKFDALLVHNIFSHGRHIAAASAFARIVTRLNIPVVSTNHDFYWERPEYQQPTSVEIQNYLAEFVPFKNSNVRHVCINSLARAELLRRSGIDGVVFPDIFDFQQQVWQLDDYNNDFLETIGVGRDDLLILQATRIVDRKGIEIAVAFVEQLGRLLHRLRGKTLYNGKVITPTSQIVFVLAGYAEKSAERYLAALKNLIKDSGITAKFISNHIGASRLPGNPKKYSLWDAYVFADLVTYPSLFEGWGNQFIEAIFARKPVALFEYPVFLTDIQKEGYSYISFGAEYQESDHGLVRIPEANMRKAVHEAVVLLTSEDTNRVLARNFRLGEKYHDFKVLRTFLQKELAR